MRRRELLTSAGALAGVAALAGCNTNDTDGDTGALASQGGNTTSMNAQVTRLIDREAGVVCYIRDHSGGTGESISCVPIEDTELADQ